MEGWELGLIIGCSVLAVILIAIVVRYLCKSKGSGSGGKNGEKQPLLGGDAKTNSTAAALRFDKKIEAQNQQHQQQNGDDGGAGGGAFLDAQATKRINAWVDEIERIRAEGNLIPLTGNSSNNNSNPSTRVSTMTDGGNSVSTQGDMLGDTPDVGGMATPRTPNNLSPRISGVDMNEGGQSSTQGVYMGYSPKVVP